MLSQRLIGCLTLSQEDCKLIGWNLKKWVSNLNINMPDSERISTKSKETLSSPDISQMLV